MKTLRRIYIELSNKCNLHCSFCPYPDLKRSKNNMDFGLIKKIIDNIERSVDYRILYFHNLSEPFLYKGIEKVFSYCDKKNIVYGVTTNGLLLDKMIDKIKDKNISEINISFQVTKEVLHKRRGTMMNIDEYRNFITNGIKKLRIKGFLNIIKIKLLTSNKYSYFKNKKFDNIDSIRMFIDELNKIYYNFFGYKLDNNQIKKISKLNLHKHIKIQIKPKTIVEIFPFLTWGNYQQNAYNAYLGRCDAIVNQLVITSDGNVVPCCYDIDSELILGNVKNNLLSDILNNNKSKLLQKEFNSLFIKQKRCRQCLGNLSFCYNFCNQIQSIFYKNKYTPSKTIII